MDFSNHDKGVTSVKVHHQPGGASNFSLSHDANDDRFQSNKQQTAAAFNAVQNQDYTHEKKQYHNQSQFSLGGGVEQEDPRYPRKGAGQANVNHQTNVVFGGPEEGKHEEEDPRFPRKQANQQ